jgi:hypothetical protein
MFLQMNNVAIAATFFLSSQNAGILQVGNDAHGGTLRNSDPLSDVSHPSCRILRQTNQGMRMVAKKVPHRCWLDHGIKFTGHEYQEIQSMIYMSCNKCQWKEWLSK